MSAFTDFLVKFIAPEIEKLGEAGLDAELQKFHDDKPEAYTIAITALATGIKPLLEYTDKSSDVVKGLVKAFDEAITLSAAANGIVLT
jgi:hypothetical protein